MTNQLAASTNNVNLLAVSMDGLVRLLAARQDAKEGVALMRRMIAAERQKYATNSFGLGQALAGDAELLIAFGQYEEAEILAREARQLLSTSPSPVPEAAGVAEAALGWALCERAWAAHTSKPQAQDPKSETATRAREAEQLLREGLAARTQATNATNWRVADMRGRLAWQMSTTPNPVEEIFVAACAWLQRRNAPAT